MCDHPPRSGEKPDKLSHPTDAGHGSPGRKITPLVWAVTPVSPLHLDLGVAFLSPVCAAVSGKRLWDHHHEEGCSLSILHFQPGKIINLPFFLILYPV